MKRKKNRLRIHRDNSHKKLHLPLHPPRGPHRTNRRNQHSYYHGEVVKVVAASMTVQWLMDPYQCQLCFCLIVPQSYKVINIIVLIWAGKRLTICFVCRTIISYFVLKLYTERFIVFIYEFNVEKSSIEKVVWDRG